MEIQTMIIIAVLCLFIPAEAQNTTNYQNDVINPLHPSMAVVLIVLSLMLFITFAIVAYAKFCQRIDPRTSEPPGGIVRSRSRFSGIDRTVVESLPFFRFSSLKGSKDGLECAVCLSRFEETETLRLLPKCCHAFHVDCIDKWLEDHSSCPLCRYRLNVGDIKSLACPNSFRVDHHHHEASLEFFIQREQSQGRSSRFFVANTIQKVTRGRKEEPLIQEFKNDGGGKMVHKFKHKIIVSDVMHKSRWSDVNYSDMITLNSEMLSVMSRKGLSSSSGRLTNDLSAKEQILKIKEDMERKRVYESKIVAKNGNSSECHNIELDGSMMFSRSLDPDQKRSMSEITNISRFTELNTSSRMSTTGSSTQAHMEKDEKVRRLWFPIARRTIHWFSVRETSNDARNHPVNV